MFKKAKAKAKALQLAPLIMQKVPEFSGKKKKELQTMLIAKYKEAKKLQDQNKLDDNTADQLYIDQSALALAYFHIDKKPPKPKAVQEFMNSCAADAGITIDEEE